MITRHSQSSNARAHTSARSGDTAPCSPLAPGCVTSRLSVTLKGEQLADHYAAHLLRSLGITTHHAASGRPDANAFERDAARDWAQSGLMWLTGDPCGPPGRGGNALPSCARGALSALAALADLQPIDGAALLVERSVLQGYHRRGRVSANGSCRLLEAADGTLALNLARVEDWALLPAWLKTVEPVSRWEQVAQLLAGRKVDPMVARGRLLGLPVAGCSASAASPELPRPWFRRCGGSTRVVRRDARAPFVVDLSSLWAGPLSSHLLQAAGARVIKVESSRRSDGMRSGAPDFFDLLNAGKDSVLVDLQDPVGRDRLLQLIARADIVIESSRPRALAQLGIDAQRLVGQRPGMIWISITGYGRDESRANWVAFGDDAAVAAGVVTTDADGSPLFCGDALCDPLTGMHVALAAMAFWRLGEGGLLDINLCDVAARCRAFFTAAIPGLVSPAEAGEKWVLTVASERIDVLKPRARRPVARAPELGADTLRVLRELGIPC